MVCLADHITLNFLKAVFHKFYLVHSWIPWPIYTKKTKKKHALRSTNNQVKFVEDNLVESTGNIGTESTVAPKVQETLITG